MPGPAPELELVARLTVTISEPIEVGAVDAGYLRVIPITGGTVEGPLVVGEVLALGADWNLRVREGRELVSARYLIRTDDGVVLSVTNEGVLSVSGTSVTGVTRPRIEAPHGRYAWLNDAVLTGTLAPVVENGVIRGVALEFWQAAGTPGLAVPPRSAGG
ncbi:DUF3237 family protein [Kineosporia sp. A_224]|uniref:DUF3237 family protein n=1 Tax=Kineosporia sp. A_224 TaxID=1962180 RepID=UPI0013040941|nr:DUF3237 family protein [Kineosporia sp. A_224]